MNNPNDHNTNPNNPDSTIQISNDQTPDQIDPSTDPLEHINQNDEIHDLFTPEIILSSVSSDLIKRPIPPSSEDCQRLRDSRLVQTQSEAERMQAMINLPPSFQDDDNDNFIETVNPEIIEEVNTSINLEIDTETEMNVPTVMTEEITESTDDGQSTLTAMMNAPVEQYHQMANVLGMKDTDLEGDIRFDTNLPLHAPIDPAEIKQIKNLNKQTLTEKTLSQSRPSQIEMKLANVTEPEVKQNDQITEESVPIKELTIESAQPEVIPVVQVERSIISSISAESTEASEDLMKQLLEKQIETKKVLLPPSQEINPIRDVVSDDEIDNALDEIPILSGGDINNNVVNESQIEIDGVDSTHQDDNIAQDNLIDSAFSLAVESTGRLVYGEDYKPLFTASDLEINLTEMDPATLVIPNVSMDDLAQYCVQSTPKILKDATDQLYREVPGAKEGIAPEINKVAMSINDPSSYLYRMHSSRQFFNTPNRGFYHDVLRSAYTTHSEKKDTSLVMSRAVKIHNKDNELTLIDDTKGDKGIVLDKLKDGSIITGTSSFKMASLLINGIRKVNLYNSGFFVVIVAPKLDQLTKYYNSVRLNTGEYGRILGQFAFLPAGVEIRAALFDLVEKLVIDSNLVDYDKPGILRKAVSSLDYTTLIWAVASLMYPKGVDVESVCYNNMPDGKRCRHVESLKIDINSMRFNNWSLLNQEAIFFTDNKEPRIFDQLTEYRKKYLNDQEEECVITADGQWKAYLSIPNVFDAEMAQRAYIAEMITELQVSSEEKLDQYVRAKYLTSFIPYVQKISYVDHDLNKSVVFKDPASLTNALDNLQLKDDVNLGDAIVNFLSSKTITHICFAHHKCPVCGQYPPEAINRLIACDPEYAFFMWATARIPQ